MATASTIQLTIPEGDLPQYYRKGISQEQAKKASDLLQENHEKHHIFFRSDGFHNHIVHHALAQYALNASPDALQKGYDANASYQRRMQGVDKEALKTLQDPAKFMQYLGPQEYYATWLQFFKDEIQEHSWEKVLQKYVFAGDERADKMLALMFAGFLHPVIHLGYGVEFQQPAIIAEALAQAAVHDNWIADYLIPAENAAKSQSQPSKTIVQLLDEVHADKELSESAHWSDGNKIRDGILKRAPENMIKIAAQYHVKPEELEEKTAEMTNAVCYFTAAAQHPPNIVMFDFYYMHCVNSSIFWPVFNRLDWLSTANKVRLLEWKVRMDIAMYASRHSPDLKLDEIRNYKPKHPSGWDGIQDRVCDFIDDGHASKLVRAFANGQKVCERYEDKDEFMVKADDWLQMGHMAIDSVENMVCLCGSAKTSWHNFCFLEGPREALINSIDFEGGHYKDQAHKGLRAFARVYSTWALSQEWFRNQSWEQIGCKSLHEFLDLYWSGSGDANDRLALLWTWQQGDIGLYNPEDSGDLGKTLGKIKARCLIMPARTDQYFPPEDNEAEVSHLKHGVFKPIDTVWGHMAGSTAAIQEDKEFIVREIKSFLGV